MEEWVFLAEVYQPDEAQLMLGLLQMAEIPARAEHEAVGELFGLSTGPLACIRLLVPANCLAAAQEVLAGEHEALED